MTRSAKFRFVPQALARRFRRGPVAEPDLPAAQVEIAEGLRARGQRVSVVFFALDAEADYSALGEALEHRAERLAVPVAITFAGPARAEAVLAGALPSDGILVVLAGAVEDPEDRLMDLVTWLLANGRESLATHLIYVSSHAGDDSQSLTAFRRVRLDADFGVPVNAEGSAAAGSNRSATEPLLEAIFDQATGLPEA
ncbi:hypothetical protein [Glutamicibacter sp. X7]